MKAASDSGSDEMERFISSDGSRGFLANKTIVFILLIERIFIFVGRVMMVELRLYGTRPEVS